MESRRILLLGGGGHCRSVLDSLLSLEEYTKVGIIDWPGKCSNGMYGVPVAGSDKDLPRLFREGWKYAFVTMGSIGDYKRREILYHCLLDIGFEVPVICDSSAVVSRNTALESGTFVGKHAIINSGTTVGACTIINTGAILEHDCTIGTMAHISTGSTLCGGVSVGDGTHIGAGTVIRQELTVGANSIIGIGSVVTRNIADHVMAFGNPCKVVKAL